MDLTRTWIWIWFGLVLFGFVWVVLFSLTCESLAFAALVRLSSLPVFGMSFALVIPFSLSTCLHGCHQWVVGSPM